MMLTPLDLENVAFGRSFRGYNDEEVDNFLEQVAGDYEKIFKENQRLKEEFSQLQKELEHYQNLEQTLNNTMVLAEKTAEEVKRNAQKEADLLFKEARVKADEIISEAEKKAEETYRRYAELQEASRNFKIKFCSFLEAQLELLRDFPGEENTGETSHTKIIAG